MHKSLTVAVVVTLVGAAAVIGSQSGMFGTPSIKGDIAGGRMVFCCNQATYTCEAKSVTDAIGQCFTNSYGDLAQCMSSCVEPPCPAGMWRNPASHACETTVVAPPLDPGCPAGMHRDATNPSACMPDMTAPPPPDPGCPAGLSRDPFSGLCMVPAAPPPNPADTDCRNRGGLVTPTGCSCPPPLTWNETGTACIPVGPIAPPELTTCPPGLEFNITGTMCIAQSAENCYRELGETCGNWSERCKVVGSNGQSLIRASWLICDRDKNLLCNKVVNPNERAVDTNSTGVCVQGIVATEKCPAWRADGSQRLVTGACYCPDQNLIGTNKTSGGRSCLPRPQNLFHNNGFADALAEARYVIEVQMNIGGNVAGGYNWQYSNGENLMMP